MSVLAAAVKSDKIELFQISQEMVGQTIIVRPLPNIKNLNKFINGINIKSMDFKESNSYYCYALIDDKLYVLRATSHIMNISNSNIYGGTRMWFLNNNKALKIKISNKGLLDYKYEVITDDKYEFSNTPEKKEYILSLLNNTNDSLEEIIEKEIEYYNTLYKDKLTNFKLTKI